MNSYPKITIVTPSYNQGQFIEETIDSILSQGYPNLEYIIMDGGSTDQSVDVIKKYAHHLAYWVSEPDKGQSDAIHRGILHSTGELCNWINSDDVLAENGLKAIAETYLKNPQVDFIHGKNGIIDQDGHFKGWIQHPKDELDLRYLFSMPYGQQACFFTRKVYDKVRGINSELKFSMDFDLYTKIHLVAQAIQIDGHIGSIRLHEDTKTSNLQEVMHHENGRIMATMLHSVGCISEAHFMESLGFERYPDYVYKRQIPSEMLKEAFYKYLEKVFWYYHVLEDSGIGLKILNKLVACKRRTLMSKETFKLYKDLILK
jgi:glycosyltransferase involved in cell wall biosynthesis